MGVDYQVARAISRCSNYVKPDGKYACLGRQDLNMRKWQLKRFFREELELTNVDAMQSDGFSDKFFDIVGYKHMQSIDCNDYEGAGFVQDLNEPLRKSLYNVFDFIIDGGTIEHVFDTKTAFESVFNMLTVGGILLSVNGANNHFGHGFYQYSPEIIWRYWQDVKKCKIHWAAEVPVNFNEPHTILSDPRHSAIRPTSAFAGPSYLIYIVEKTTEDAAYSPPQQSFYKNKWSTERP